MSTLLETAVAKVKETLMKFPDVQLIAGERSIKVAAADPNGYDVELTDDGDEVTIWAGPYHTHFDDAEEAAEAFLWMLTPAYRIVENLRGKHMTSARLQREEDGKWVTLGTMGLLVPLFGRKSQRIHQNRTLPIPD